MNEPTAAINAITGQIIDSAITVHKALGPGLLESFYELCLAHELGLRGLHVAQQIWVKAEYKGIQMDQAFRLDLIVADVVVVEVKAVEQIAPVHQAQLLTYLKLSKLNIGLLINFNVPILKSGIRRLILSN